MKKIFLAIALSCVLVGCTKELANESLVESVESAYTDAESLRRAIYLYQEILDTYVSDDVFGDIIAESETWAELKEILGSPYGTKTSEFWAGYYDSRSE